MTSHLSDARLSIRGYALKINHAMPLEVEVLVSHSWNENAEAGAEILPQPEDLFLVFEQAENDELVERALE